MKTLRYIGMVLMAVVLCVSFTACSDDDDEDGNASTLVGTWVEETNGTIEVFHKQFNADGTGYHWATNNGEIDYWGKSKITWRTSGNSLFITFPEEGEVKYTYKVEEDKLTTIFEDEVIIYKRQ